MKDILAKILYFILALIILTCLFIGLCAVNPDIANPLKKMAADVAEKKKISEENAAEENSAVAVLEISIEEEQEEYEEEEEVSVDGPETAHPYDYDRTYQDYVYEWDDSVVDEDCKNNPDYKEFVDAFINPKEDVDEGDYPEDSSHMLSPQPEIVDIEDEDKAQEIIDSVDYGETGEGLEFDELYYPYYHMLNDRCKALYRQMYANALALNTKFAPINEETSDAENKSHRRMEFSVYLPPCVSSDYRPASDTEAIDGDSGTDSSVNDEKLDNSSDSGDGGVKIIVESKASASASNKASARATAKASASASASAYSSGERWTDIYKEQTGTDLKDWGDN